MNWLKFAIIAYVTVLLQTALAPALLPETVQPNILVVVATFYLLRTSASDEALVVCLILGLLGDITSISPLGSQVIGFALFAFVARSLRPMIFTEYPSAHAFCALAGYLILMLTYRAIAMLPTGAVLQPAGIFELGLGGMLTAALAAATCKLFVRASKFAH